MHKTLVFVNELAFSLKVLTEVAQVPVSILGNIFNMILAPVKSASEAVPKSILIRLKSVAFEPTDGNSPFV
jgi:hypothetical protein